MASIKQIYPGLTFNHDGATGIGLVLNEEHMSNLSDTLILAGSILLTEGYKNEGDILSDMGAGIVDYSTWKSEQPINEVTDEKFEPFFNLFPSHEANISILFKPTNENIPTDVILFTGVELEALDNALRKSVEVTKDLDDHAYEQIRALQEAVSSNLNTYKNGILNE